MIVIIDYGMGNTRSVLNAVNYLGFNAIISAADADIRQARKLILPGVGAFGPAMENLKDLNLIELLHNEVIINGKPILGICLGMQLFAKQSQEAGINCCGLGWLDAKVELIQLSETVLRIPHIGWNGVSFHNSDGLFANIDENSLFYFSHDYTLLCDNKLVTSTVDYGGELVASVKHKHIVGTQFHPERSKMAGLKVFENFLT